MLAYRANVSAAQVKLLYQLAERSKIQDTNERRRQFDHVFQGAWFHPVYYSLVSKGFIRRQDNDPTCVEHYLTDAGWAVLRSICENARMIVTQGDRIQELDEASQRRRPRGRQG